MGKLNILYHKSYHVYNRDNVERVKRDELKAELEAEAKTQSTIAANSEARLTLLRQQKDQAKTESWRHKEKRIERALDDQLKGKKRQPPSEPDHVPPRCSTDNSSIIDPKNGHINFWSSLEHQSSSKQFENSKLLEQNESYVKDQKKAEEKWDAMITMRLDKPAHELKPWYSQSDLKNGEEKKLSSRKLADRSSKDSQLKHRHDPLSSVHTFLQQRQAARSGSTAFDLPNSTRNGKRKERQASRSPSPPSRQKQEPQKRDHTPNIQPNMKPPCSSSKEVRVLKVDRDAERGRAQALLAAHRHKTHPPPSETGTPMTYGNLYNRDEMRAVRHDRDHHHRRWDDEPRRSKKSRYWE